MIALHEAPRALAEEFFAGRLEPERFDELFGHMRDCDECRSYFELVRAGHRALGPENAPGLARHEADLIERQLLAELAPRPRPKWFWKPLAATLAVASVAAVALLVRPSDELQARAGAEARSLVRALCLNREAARPAQDGCRVGEFLMLAQAGANPPEVLTVTAFDASGASLHTWTWRREAPEQLMEGHLALAAPGRIRLVASAGEERAELFVEVTP